jgi:hypothetical protein
MSVFPIYHVLADLSDRGDMGARQAIPTTEKPLVAMVLEDRRGTSVVVANLAPQRLAVQIGPLVGQSVSIRSLDDVSFVAASIRPSKYRRTFDRIALRHGTLDLQLAPYAYVHIRSASDRANVVSVAPGESLPRANGRGPTTALATRETPP